MKFGLTDSQIERVNEVFSKYSDVEKVLIYGSRAKDNYKASSDIDLSLFGKNIDLSKLLKIELELDDLLLPYKFDLSIYHKLTNADFISHINRVGIEFYKQTSQT